MIIAKYRRSKEDEEAEMDRWLMNWFTVLWSRQQIVTVDDIFGIPDRFIRARIINELLGELSVLKLLNEVAVLRRLQPHRSTITVPTTMIRLLRRPHHRSGRLMLGRHASGVSGEVGPSGKTFRCQRHPTSPSGSHSPRTQF